MPARGASIASLLGSLRKRRASLPAELGSFAVLELVEAMRKTRMALVDEHSVMITDEGQVSIGAPITQDEAAAVRSACSLLASLLSLSARPPSQQLMRLAVPAAGQAVLTLAALRDDLEASLVPLNRQASRRVLARMVREMGWENEQADELAAILADPDPQPPVGAQPTQAEVAVPPAKKVPRPSEPPTMDELDGELNRLLSGSERPPVSAADSRPFRVSRPPPPVQTLELDDERDEATDASAAHESPRGVDNDNAAQLRRSAWGAAKLTSSPPEAIAAEPPLPKFPPPSPLPRFDVPPAAKPVASSPTARTVVDRDADPSSAGLPLGTSLPRARADAGTTARTFLTDPPPSSGKGVWMGIGFGALALGLIGTVFWLRPDLRARLDGTELVATAPTPPAAPPVPVRRGGDLHIKVDVERAQVLRFVGRGPALLANVDTGLVHELVALADGFTPTRLLVSKTAEWESTDAGTWRFETAMQLTPGTSTDVGESLLTSDVGAPSSRFGELRVVTTPKGAKIYELVGFAPEASIADVATDQVHEFLIARPGYASQVRVVSPSDFVDHEGRARAELDVKLTR